MTANVTDGTGGDSNATETHIDNFLDKAEGVESIGGKGDAAQQDQSQQDTQQQHTQQPGQQQTKTGQAGPNAGKSTGQQSGTTQTNQQQGKARPAQNGDLVDAQGRVVAKAGAERRFYEDSIRLRNEAQQTAQRLQDAEHTIAAYREAATMPTQLGLGPDEVASAMQLMAMYKKSPIETLKYLLTEAQAAGHNVAQLVGGQGNLDPAAIKRMIADELKPLTARAASEQALQQAQHEGAQEAEQFFTQFPDARLHEPVIVSMMSKDERMTPREAYFQLRAYVIERGLNWNAPLADQVGQANGGTGQQQSHQPANRGVPTTGRQGQAPNLAERNNSAVRSEAMSNRDIVRAAMRDSGLNV